MNGVGRREIAEALTASVASFMESGADDGSISTLLRSIHPILDMGSSLIDHGVAISPQCAFACIEDDARTLAFLGGLNLAVQEVLARKSSVHVLEAGGGPNPLSVLLPAAQDPRVKVTSVDIHRQSIEASNNLARELGVSFHGIQADITSADWDCETPDIIMAETMTSGLLNEPQGAITWALVQRFGTQAIFLPERITVHALLNRGQYLDSGYPQRFHTHFHTLGELACIDAAFRNAAKTTPLSTALNIRRGFEVPDGWGDAFLCVHTTVDVYDRFNIPSNASVITSNLRFKKQTPNGARRIEVVGKMGGPRFSVHRSFS